MAEAELFVDNMELEGGMMHHLLPQQARKRKDPPEQDEIANTCPREHHLLPIWLDLYVPHVTLDLALLFGH